MMAKAVCWLPDTALLDGQISEHIEAALNSWLTPLTEDEVRVHVSLSNKFAMPAEAYMSWCMQDDLFCLAAAQKAEAPLAELIIGVPLNSRRWNKADLLVRGELAKHVLSGLVKTLSDIFGIDLLPCKTQPPFPRPDSHEFWGMTIQLGNETLLFESRIDRQLLSELRRKLVSYPASAPALQKLSEGLARQAVKIGAAIGSAQISVKDFHTLEEGDVIVLDHAASDLIPLTLNSDVINDLACGVQEKSGHLELKLQQADMV